MFKLLYSCVSVAAGRPEDYIVPPNIPIFNDDKDTDFAKVKGVLACAIEKARGS